MAKVFRDFVFEILERTMPFKEELKYLNLKRDQAGTVVAAMPCPGRVISVQAACLKEMPELVAPACLGSLPYLHSLLRSKYMKGDKDFEITFNNKPGTDGSTTVLRSLAIKAGGMESFYQATDPFINNLNKITPPKVTDWAVMFGVDRSFIEEFEEVSKIHAMAERGLDIFSLGFDGKAVMASFGQRVNQTSVVLTTNTEALHSTVRSGSDKMSALFAVKEFKGLFKLLGGSGIMMLAPKALKVESDSEMARYTGVLTAKKLEA